MARLTTAVVGLTAALVGAGCTSEGGANACDRSAEANPLVTYREGDAEGGVYMTSGWDEELLYFPGGMRYEIVHGLGATPRLWQAYLSFQARGLAGGSDDPGDAERGTLALAAGNQVELVEVDACTITVANATCADYWLLVVADAGDVEPEPSLCAGR
jgi:hypothetical protein